MNVMKILIVSLLEVLHLHLLRHQKILLLIQSVMKINVSKWMGMVSLHVISNLVAEL